MNMAVRRFFVRNPILRGFYVKARTVYNRRRFLGRAKRLLVNVDDYRKALVSEDGEVVDIHTKDGLTLSIRRNVIDAVILGENYLDNSYVRGLTLPERPTVVDVGGFIGDFAVYAVKYLNARKVVVYEPSQQNWVLLQRNVANNQLQDRIRTVNKAVTDGHDIR
jgi:Met-10+ like-protein